MSFPLLTVGPKSEAVERDARILLGRPFETERPVPPSHVELDEQFFVEWEVAETN